MSVGVIFPVLALVIVTIAIGYLRPVLGLVLFAAFIAVTPSLPWQLGLGSLHVSALYLFSMLVGVAFGRVWRSRTDAKDRGPPITSTRCLAPICIGFPLVLVCSAAVALAGAAQAMPESALLHLSSLWPAILFLNPPGLARGIVATLVPLLGVAIFVVAVDVLRTRRAQDTVRRAIAVGACLAVAGPVLQYVTGLDLTVRPDRGSTQADGWVGFFQDPHSFAAYLVLALGLCLGMSAGMAAAGSYRKAAGLGGLALTVSVVLWRTNSRSGLIAGALTVVALVLMSVLIPHPSTHAQSSRSRRVWTAAAIVLALAVGVFALSASNSLRQGGSELVDLLGHEKAFRLLEPDADVWSLLKKRPLHWEKARVLIARRPLWGIDPGGFAGARVAVFDSNGRRVPPRRLRENAHNYYLQLAAEFGLPALFFFLALVGATLGYLVKGASRHPDHGARGLLLGVVAGQIGLLTLCLVAHPLLLAEIQGIYWLLSGLGVAVASQLGDAPPLIG